MSTRQRRVQYQPSREFDNDAIITCDIRFDSNSTRPHYYGKVRPNVMRMRLSHQHHPYLRTLFMVPVAASDISDSPCLTITGKEDVNWSFKNFENLVFPNIFGFSKRTWDCYGGLNFASYAKLRFGSLDARYSRDIFYTFTALKKLLCTQVFKSMAATLHHLNVTREEAEQILRRIKPTDRPNSPLLKRHFRGIPTFASYFRAWRFKINSHIEQHGSPHLFVTLSIDEKTFIKRQPAIICNKILNNSKTSLSYEDIITYHPSYTTFAEYEWLENSYHLLTTYLADENLPVLHSFRRYEFQQRGTLHVHMLLWLKNAPEPLDFHEDDIHRWNEILPRIISGTGDQLNSHTRPLQTHSHYAKCFKQNVLKCKFPRLPSKEFVTLLPATTTPENKLHCESLIKNWKSQLTNDTTVRTMSWGAWLAHIGFNAESYYNTIACSLLRPTILSARSPADSFTNDFIPAISDVISSNMDVQPILTTQEATKYITKYVSKAEPQRITSYFGSDPFCILKYGCSKEMDRPMTQDEASFTLIGLSPCVVSWTNKHVVPEHNGPLFISTPHNLNNFGPPRTTTSQFSAFIKKNDDKCYFEFMKNKYKVDTLNVSIPKRMDSTENIKKFVALFVPRPETISAEEIGSETLALLLANLRRLVPYHPILINTSFKWPEFTSNESARYRLEKQDYEKFESEAIQLNSLVRPTGNTETISSPSITLNAQQLAILIFFSIQATQTTPIKMLCLGGPGTGKSTLIHILKRLGTEGNFWHQSLSTMQQPQVELAAPTGTAAYNINGKTIESLFEIGRAAKNNTDNRHITLNSTGLLIVDEVSMIGQKKFEQMSNIMDSAAPAAHTVLFGDFHQLPPVSDISLAKITDSNCLKSYCGVVLNDNMRSDDDALTTLLQDIRNDSITPLTLTRLRSRARPWTAEAVKHTELCLFFKNKDKEIFNQSKLSELPGVPFLFEQSHSTPLALKVNARIMITTNIKVPGTQILDLTNGMMGNIVGFKCTNLPKRYNTNDIKNIVVQLDDGRVRYINRTSTHNGYGFPLELAYGITIHKAQGMTLKKPFGIYCSGIKDIALIYTAISRATRLKHITLYDWNARALETKFGLTNETAVANGIKPTTNFNGDIIVNLTKTEINSVNYLQAITTYAPQANIILLTDTNYQSLTQALILLPRWLSAITTATAPIQVRRTKTVTLNTPHTIITTQQNYRKVDARVIIILKKDKGKGFSFACNQASIYNLGTIEYVIILPTSASNF